jgi:hypothetical protein
LAYSISFGHSLSTIDGVTLIFFIWSDIRFFVENGVSYADTVTDVKAIVAFE